MIGRWKGCKGLHMAFGEGLEGVSLAVIKLLLEDSATRSA